MTELKCNNCGSNELMLEHGIYSCQSCGSRFLLDRADRAKIATYRYKMINSMGKLDLEKPAKYVNKLLALDPKDPYAWTGMVWLAIEEGLNLNAGEAVACAKRALEYARETATKEEYKDIKEFMYSHFHIYGRKIMMLVPGMAADIEEILKEVDLKQEDFL